MALHDIRTYLLRFKKRGEDEITIVVDDKETAFETFSHYESAGYGWSIHAIDHYREGETPPMPMIQLGLDL